MTHFFQQPGINESGMTNLWWRSIDINELEGAVVN